jgi:hypothetical protein
MFERSSGLKIPHIFPASLWPAAAVGELPVFPTSCEFSISAPKGLTVRESRSVTLGDLAP